MDLWPQSSRGGEGVKRGAGRKDVAPGPGDPLAGAERPIDTSRLAPDGAPAIRKVAEHTRHNPAVILPEGDV